MPRRRRPPRPGAMAELPPLRIASQIASLQALYYLVAFVFVLFTALVAGTSFSLDLIFGWEVVRGDTTQGWLYAFVWLLNGGLCMAMAIMLLIGRSKLVPDFAITIHGIHLVVTTLYTHRIPRHAMWWFAMFASSGACVVLGVWGSQWRETRAVFFGGGGGGAAGGAGGAGVGGYANSGDGEGSRSHGEENGGAEDVVGDEEQGFSRGRGRGRGRDSAGEYEMVGMKKGEDGGNTKVA